MVGVVKLSGLWPADVPLYLQWWIADASAVQGVSASNALVGTP